MLRTIKMSMRCLSARRLFIHCQEKLGFQVTDVVKVSLDENLKMVSDTIAYLKAKNREVFLMPSILMDIRKIGNMP